MLTGPTPPRRSGIADLFDRTLDKGILIDALVRLSSAGIDLVGEDRRIVIAAAKVHLSYAEVRPTV